MLDWNHIGQYRENNRLEAKKAQGGLPHSIWETYSAFANSYGGMILLGVVEDKVTKTFSSVPLPCPEQLVADFWNTLGDPATVSVNILQPGDVRIVESGGNRIVVIEVPRAQAHHRPVYIGNDPISGTYRRNGEGDYRCTPTEVQAMLGRRAQLSQDSRVQEHAAMEDLDRGNIAAYRAQVAALHPQDAQSTWSDEEFLRRCGAAGYDSTGTLRPTAAGLLLLGRKASILSSFPYFALDYQDSIRRQRISTATDPAIGSLYSFFHPVFRALAEAIRDEAVLHAAREAVVNALVHADYHNPQGLVIQLLPRRLRIANPGAFRVEPRRAMAANLSDRRNATLAHLFSLMGLGGSGGLAAIRALWAERGWQEPEILESFGPDRTVLTLPLRSAPAAPKGSQRRCDAIIRYLTATPCATSAQIAQAVGLSASRTRVYLRILEKKGILVQQRKGFTVSYYLSF